MTVIAKLTASQVELLRFLANQRDPPHRVTRCGYEALEAQGIIERRSQCSRWRITRRGKSVLRRLEER
jgi:hypothetical protein